MIEQIKNKKDIRSFVNYVIKKLRLNYHIEEGFEGIWDKYLPKEKIKLLDKLNLQCARVNFNYTCDYACEVSRKLLDKEKK